MGTLLFEPIKTHSKMVDSVIVSFSGGKDSIVTLDLCKRYFKNVHAFFMYVVPGLSFQENTLRRYERLYDIEIERIPHPDMARFMKYGTYRSPDDSVPILEFNDCYDYIRTKTGVQWIAGGERINDSLNRRAMLKSGGSIDMKRFRFFPLLHWNKNEVVEYIRRNSLYLPEDTRVFGHSFCDLSGESLYLMKKHFPKDYERLLKYYPLADVAVARYQIYKK